MFNYSSLPLSLLERVQAALPEGVDVYLVGGAVRDALLDRPTYDLDFVTASAVRRMSRKVANALGAAYYLMDQERDTARVVLKQENGSRVKLDFARMRGADLQSDLAARDFTINALAVPLNHLQTLIDPLGGAADLRSKVLRACSPSAFEDDPVRILRGVRLACALGYKMRPETNQQIRQAVHHLPGVSAERVRDELFRILDGPRPATALRLLDMFNALRFVLPEIADLKGVSQSPPHVQDAWNHTLDLIQRLEQILQILSVTYDPEKAASWAMGFVSLQLGRYRQQLRELLDSSLNPDRSRHALLLLAGLYHDCGKPATGKLADNGRMRFIAHEHLGAELAVERGVQLRLSNQEVKQLELIVRNHMRPLLLAQSEEQPTRRALYRYFRATGEAGVEIALLSLADILAIYGSTLPRETWARQLSVVRSLLDAWWERPEQAVSPPKLVNGNDLIRIFGLEPGPQIGRLLEEIREAQAIGQVNNREQALEVARKLIEAD